VGQSDFQASAFHDILRFSNWAWLPPISINGSKASSGPKRKLLIKNDLFAFCFPEQIGNSRDIERDNEEDSGRNEISLLRCPVQGQIDLVHLFLKTLTSGDIGERQEAARMQIIAVGSPTASVATQEVPVKRDHGAGRCIAHAETVVRERGLHDRSAMDSGDKQSEKQ
jgi:hypothetical protein